MHVCILAMSEYDEHKTRTHVPGIRIMLQLVIVYCMHISVYKKTSGSQRAVLFWNTIDVQYSVTGH